MTDRAISPAQQWSAALVLALVAAGIYWHVSTHWSRAAANGIQRYEIAKRSGSHTDACVQASLVSSAFLQAKNERDYAKWKAVEKDECTKAAFFR